MDDQTLLRNKLVALGRAIDTAGLARGTSGNLSARVGESFLCTPSGASLGSLAADDLRIVPVHADAPVAGATKDVPIHRAAYVADPTVGAVVHTHSTYATIVSCLEDIDPLDAIPALTPYLTMLAGPVAVVPYHPPGSEALGPAVSDLVGRGFRALLLANHGPVAVAEDLRRATAIAIELEEAAKVMVLSAGLPVRRLGPAQVAELTARRLSR